MVKRSNENAQLSKEELAAAEAANESAEPVGTFQRASEEVMKKRRQLRLSGEGKWKSPGAASTASTSPANPFGSTQLATATTTSASTTTAAFAPDAAAEAPAVNPFANVELAPPPLPPSMNSKLVELNAKWYPHLEDMMENSPRSDWGGPITQYVNYRIALISANIPEPTVVVAAPPPAAAPTAPTAVPVAAAAPTLGATAPAPAFAANMPTPSATAAPAVAPSAATTTTTPTSSATTSTQQEKSVGTNPKSTSTHKTRAKYYRLVGEEEEDKSWKGFAAGDLSLEYSGSTKVLVIRNEARQVQFNVALPTDCKIEEVTSKTGAKHKYIQFLTQEKKDEKLFYVRIKTKPEDLQPLYQAIQDLANM